MDVFGLESCAGGLGFNEFVSDCSSSDAEIPGIRHVVQSGFNTLEVWRDFLNVNSYLFYQFQKAFSHISVA